MRAGYLLAILTAFAVSGGAQAQTAPIFDVDDAALDMRLGAEVRPDSWTLTEGLNPDVMTVPVPSRGGSVEACLASGEHVYCQRIAVGQQHDFVIRSGGKSYPTRFEGVYQPPMAVFDAAYRAENRGRIRTGIPEVYELVNIAIALTPYAEEHPRLVYTASPYHAEVMARFGELKDHPFVAALDRAMRQNASNYFHLKMNGYAFVYGPGDRIERSAIYDRTGFNGRAANDLAPLLSEMQDFSDRAGFRAFFAEHRGFYQSQTDFYRDELNLEGMQAWLRAQFPGVKPYDTTNVIFSPLVFGNQSVTWITTEGFSELQPHVNFPYPDTAETGLSPEAAKLRRGYIVFTELNHGFINPTADRYGARTGEALGDRALWARPGSPSDSYSTSSSVFNEMMNWGLVSLYVIDKAPAADHERMLADLDGIMVERRGFIGFPTFNAFLTDLYRNRRAGQTIEDLYPQIIDWFEARKAVGG